MTLQSEKISAHSAFSITGAIERCKPLFAWKPQEKGWAPVTLKVLSVIGALLAVLTYISFIVAMYMMLGILSPLLWLGKGGRKRKIAAAQHRETLQAIKRAAASQEIRPTDDEDDRPTDDCWHPGMTCIDLEIVGESFYQDYLGDIMRGEQPDADGRVRKWSYVRLKPEPDNPYDPNAVVVLIKGKPVGHVKRGDTGQILPLLHERGSKQFGATIVGPPDGPFGVFLGRKWI